MFDAAGLGLFSVAGTLKALDYGLGPIAATALGVTTAVGGGVLRDVIARETPTLIRSGSELYAVPAAAGAAIVALAWELGVYGPMLGAASAVAVFAVRGLALRRQWHAAPPAPRRLTEQRHETFAVSGVVRWRRDARPASRRRPGSRPPAPRAWP